jgi:hypothetical protein
LICDGNVLLAGGWDANGNLLATTEIYVPQTGVFEATIGMTMAVARVSHTATALLDGSVLVAGGDTMTAKATTPVSSAELYP